LPPDQLPLPTSSVRLPYPFSLAAGDDGVVFVSNRDQVLAVDGVGTVSMAAEFSTIWDDIGRPDVDGDGRPSVPGALGIDNDGALLVSFFYEQLVVRVAESGGTVLARGAALASDGLNASYSPGSDLLVLLLNPDSGREDPPQVGVFGR